MRWDLWNIQENKFNLGILKFIHLLLYQIHTSIYKSRNVCNNLITHICILLKGMFQNSITGLPAVLCGLEWLTFEPLMLPCVNWRLTAGWVLKRSLCCHIIASITWWPNETTHNVNVYVEHKCACTSTFINCTSKL